MNIFGFNPTFTFNETTHSPGESFGPRMQPHLSIVYYYTGNVTLRLGDAVYQAKAGDAILIPPGTQNFFQCSPTGKARHGWCTIPSIRLDKTAEEALHRPLVIVPFSNMMRRIASLGYQLRNATSIAELRLRSNLGMAIFNAYLADSNFLREEEALLPEPVARVKKLIETRYPEELSLPVMARTACLSGTYLIRLFTKHMGQSPVDYLWNVRVAHGVELIKSTGLRISEIADQTGFKTFSHFSRRITAACGMSPHEIRKQQAERTPRPGRR